MWPFRSKNPDDSLEKRIAKLEKGFREIAEEWEDWYDKFHRLHLRLNKRARAIEKADAKAEETPEVASEGPDGGQPGGGMSPMAARLLNPYRGIR